MVSGADRRGDSLLCGEITTAGQSGGIRGARVDWLCGGNEDSGVVFQCDGFARGASVGGDKEGKVAKKCSMYLVTQWYDKSSE